MSVNDVPDQTDTRRLPVDPFKLDGAAVLRSAVRSRR